MSTFFPRHFLHIHSNDRDAATLEYNAVITMSEILQQLTITSHHIADTPIPWIWPTVDNLMIEDTVAGGAPVISLSAGATVSTLNTTTIAALFQTQLAFVDASWAGVTVTYNSDLNTYDVDLGAGLSANIYWTNAASTATPIFGKVNDQIGTGQTFSLNADNICRPKYMLVDIAEAANHAINSHGVTTKDYHTMIVPTSDTNFTDEVIQFIPPTDTFTFSWYRSNIPDVVCPMEVSWEFVAEGLVSAFIL